MGQRSHMAARSDQFTVVAPTPSCRNLAAADLAMARLIDLKVFERQQVKTDIDELSD